MRITDYIGLGVMSKSFPAEVIEGVLARTGRASLRQRDLPAHVVVYYVIVLALYMQSSYREVLRCLLEGLQWLRDPSARLRVAVAVLRQLPRKRDIHQWMGMAGRAFMELTDRAVPVRA